LVEYTLKNPRIRGGKAHEGRLLDTFSQNPFKDDLSGKEGDFAFHIGHTHQNAILLQSIIYDRYRRFIYYTSGIFTFKAGILCKLYWKEKDIDRVKNNTIQKIEDTVLSKPTLVRS